MAPSMSADTANSARETPEHRGRHADAGNQQFGEREQCADGDGERAAGEDGRAPAASAAPQVIRQIARQHADNRHVDDVRAQGQNAAILKYQRLDGEDGAHHHARRRRTERAGQERAADEVSAGADAHRKVDHLGGKDKRAHHAEEGHFGIVKPALRDAHDVGDGGRRRGVQRGPYGRG